MSTPYHAKYFAYELSRRGGEGMERLSRTLFDACVDLNPHQIDAALFALRSPIAKGVLLADEVGLGKTIEAGLVLCQQWAERRRKLLVICPASLRKQWAIELEEKFHLPSFVLDAKTYARAQREGNPNPFSQNAVVICSMHFASRRAQEVRATVWDMVVIDEAHKLRNAYKTSNRMGQSIRTALEGRRKILLSATPLQNSLLELYGLSTLIDERIFGDLPSFRSQYVHSGGNMTDLRERLKVFCFRTLRSQVLEFIKYTQRKLITRPFRPSDQEHKLYEAISAFLQKEDSYSLPFQQRHLTTLLIRKLLASSPHAVAGTLEVMRDRLLCLRNENVPQLTLVEQIIEDEELEDDLLDELLGDEAETDDTRPVTDNSRPDQKKLEAEIQELERYILWARSIGIDTKTRTLLKALSIGFEKMSDMGALKRAVIFTESRRSQTFLYDFLASNGYADHVLTFNGTNREAYSTQIYQKWLEENKDTGRISGSRAIDVRTAITEYFRDHGSILIATEAAAEGINLQFCSLVINFDLPWNPQRIEQRIGRCHRYGQQHDVVVINFLNERNEADRRVYELLQEKFTLFSGVFGASDEVLGSIESGMDFEKRILDIYQQCRSTKEIEEAFDVLRRDFDEVISQRIQSTRELLLEHFDEDVHARLKVNQAGAQEQLDRVGRMFWSLTKLLLDGRALFDDHTYTFRLQDPPIDAAPDGTYHLVSKKKENIAGRFLYRTGHPLGEYVINSGRELATPVAAVRFDITGYPMRIAAVEELRGKSGWLLLQQMHIDSFEEEEYLLFSAFDDQGESLDQEICQKLFFCDGVVTECSQVPEDALLRLEENAERHARATISTSLERNNVHFGEARDQLEKWADDMILAAEKDLRDTKEQIKALNRQTRKASTIDEQHALQAQVRELEKKKRRQRQQIFDIEDKIMHKRDQLIDALEQRMQQRTSTRHLFTLRWEVI